ncbi:MAG: hypothetical protein GY793_08545 [Proteobacteria bacterium]|nr:hypothetical protein [Pseudomonadota bacterium]
MAIGLATMAVLAALAATKGVSDYRHTRKQKLQSQRAYSTGMKKQDDYRKQAIALKNDNIDQSLSLANKDNMKDITENIASGYEDVAQHDDLSTQADSSLNKTVMGEIDKIYASERTKQGQRSKSKGKMNAYNQAMFDSGLNQANNRLGMRGISNSANNSYQLLNNDLNHIQSRPNNFGNAVGAIQGLANIYAGSKAKA